jgi:glycosyltransferase involved in cell wall biosynthesis
MPSKLYEIMASARPVLASGDERSDMRDLVEGVGCGLYVPSADPESLAAAIWHLHDDPELRSDMGARGRREAEERYSVTAVTDAYEKLFRRIAAGSNN